MAVVLVEVRGAILVVHLHTHLICSHLVASLGDTSLSHLLDPLLLFPCFAQTLHLFLKCSLLALLS